MAEQKLPLRIRTSIRDTWDSEKTPLRQACTALATTLGIPVHLRAAFPKLVPRLQPHCGEPDAVIPRLAAALTTFLEALNARLERDDDDGGDAAGGFADRFLGRVAADAPPTQRAADGLEVFVDAAGAAPPRGPAAPKFDWHPFHKGALLLEVPRAHDYAPAPHAVAPMIERLGADEAATEAAGDEGTGTAADDDDASEWEGVATPSQSAASVVGDWSRGAGFGGTVGGGGFGGGAAEGAGRRSDLPPERMPQDFMEPRALFARTTPYLLQVSTERIVERTSERSVLRVTCSHQRSLEVLATYLRRHVRLDNTARGRTPLVKLTLKESILAGPLHDLLEIEGFDERSILRNDLRSISPVLVLSFVEGILGYQYVTDIGGVLMYRRDRPFEW